MSEKRKPEPGLRLVTSRAEAERLFGGESRTLVIHAPSKTEIEQRRKQRDDVGQAIPTQQVGFVYGTLGICALLVGGLASLRLALPSSQPVRRLEYRILMDTASVDVWSTAICVSLPKQGLLRGAPCEVHVPSVPRMTTAAPVDVPEGNTNLAVHFPSRAVPWPMA